MKMQIKYGRVSFANADYKLYINENNIYLTYYDKKSIKCRNWIYNETNKNKSFIEISKKSHNKVFIK